MTAVAYSGGGLARPLPRALTPLPSSATGPDDDHAESREGSRPDALAVALADATHWRRVAEEHRGALAELNGRAPVRIALRLARSGARLRRIVEPGLREVGGGAQRACLVIAALPTRRHLAQRTGALERAVTASAGHPPERRAVTVVVVADGEGATDRSEGATTSERITVRAGGGEAIGATVDRSVRSATGDLVCIVLATSEPLGEAWLAQLCGAVGADVVASVPALVHPRRALGHATPHDGLLRHEGLRLEATAGGVPVVRPVRAGEPADPTRPGSDVAAGSAACFVVDRSAYEAAGGLGPASDLDAAVVGLCTRLRLAGGRIVSVPAALVVDHRRVASLAALRRPIEDDGDGWSSLIREHGPALIRSVEGADLAGLRFALTVSAPSAKVALRWGDWYFAEAMGESLRRLGHTVRLQTLDRAGDPAGRACDVHLVLRGLAPVRRSAGQRHVLWVISHPESVEAKECDEADLVLVASERFAEALRSRTSTPVEVLLQATDHRRFRPLPPVPAHAHPVTVVAKTRDVLRPIVTDAIAAGLRPAIYGSGWHGLVDEALLVADHVANEDLPAVYASAGVVLNDHWEMMRTWGFVSNRLFDVLACGTPVVSDHLPELDELFDGAVPTYRTADDLGPTVRALLDDPSAARARSDTGRRAVLAHHTFDHRAEQLLAALVRHGLAEGGLPSSTTTVRMPRT